MKLLLDTSGKDATERHEGAARRRLTKRSTEEAIE